MATHLGERSENKKRELPEEAVIGFAMFPSLHIKPSMLDEQQHAQAPSSNEQKTSLIIETSVEPTPAHAAQPSEQNLWTPLVNYITALFASLRSTSKKTDEQTYAPITALASANKAATLAEATQTEHRPIQAVFEQGAFRSRYIKEDGTKGEFTEATDPVKIKQKTEKSYRQPQENKPELSASFFSKFIEFFLLGCGILPSKQPQAPKDFEEKTNLYRDVNGNYGLFNVRKTEYRPVANGKYLQLDPDPQNYRHDDGFTDLTTEFDNAEKEYGFFNSSHNIHCRIR